MTQFSLTEDQLARQGSFRGFVDREVAPLADRHDREQRVDRELVDLLAKEGMLASQIPAELGGRGLDAVSYALLHEEMGRGCSSVRSLLTVHDMVTETVRRFGGPQLRQRWLPQLLSGQALGSFALTEPDTGSDAAALTTRAEPAPDGDGFHLTGVKRWITFGQLADVFLVFARTPRGVSAFLVERDRPGIVVRPVPDMLGTRGSMLAEVELDGCRIPRANLVGGQGRAHPFVVTHALTLGRLSVACGSVGIVRAALDEATSYATARGTLRHQLVQRMIADMVVAGRAGRMLALRAGESIWARSPGAPMAATEAKYFCSRAAADAARDAVQVMGAAGCAPGAPTARLYRDAKVMEIIEGSHEISQSMIGMFRHRDGSLAHG
ncbi:glutaryl-CoA dehydrogenase (non-decarboxylating) [Streptacidiphilus sp. MAP12-20]|uniref:acyl-CoA dehydrogenase family protein n=1 Tax=Streptacidiphilus sp. MAP12-20 TaxID=3156299 RepID=UPI003517768B